MLAARDLASYRCAGLRRSCYWRRPAARSWGRATNGDNPRRFSPTSVLERAPGAFATAESFYVAGVGAEAAGNPACIDYYFAAANASWPQHAAGVVCAEVRASELYRSAVQQLITSSTRFGRFNPTQGVLLASGQLIPVSYHGFVWQPADFHTLLPVGAYSSPHITKRYVNGGIGVPYVVLTGNAPNRPFIKCGQPFAATAVLRPSCTPARNVFSLEFYDPLRINTTDTGLPLARDLTAPLAYAASREGDAWLQSFLRPDRDESADGLHMREPFQPGKIPIVFVHGLAADPQTWSHLENELRAHPMLFARYQFWMFRYDTGEPFLSSAALLRRHLAALRQTYDPLRMDPNLSRTVLLGHSMGGLVSKLQVTNSGDMLWQSAATRPFDTICTDPATRADLARAFFFTPSPDITRVIYIATPHCGSIYAQRCVGRISSALVEDPAQWQARHDQLVRDNPGAFRQELNRGVPTSVDLLEPTSQILQATTRICYRPYVRLHSIIGTGRQTLGEGPSDGVVPVSSARLPGVQSELFVVAEHTEIQRRPETSCEVMRILAEHVAVGP